MITHTHTQRHFTITHRQCTVRCQFNFNFNCWLISITSLKGVCYSIDWIDFDSILVVSCCLSHSFISNSRLDSTWLAIRDALSTCTTRRPLKTKRRYKCRLLGYRSKSKRSSQTIATNSNSNRESGGTAAAALASRQANGIELEPELELEIKQQLIPCSACGLSHC